MKETILLFHVEDKTLKSGIEQALFPFHVRVKKVPRSDYCKPLGILAGIIKEEQTAEPEPCFGKQLDAPMMIFVGISDDKLDSILHSLRSRKVRLPYKAVLTSTNALWTPLKCFEELRREHEAMSANRQKS